MLNLKESCGKRYKIFMDESWGVEKAEFKTPDAEPWYYELHARNIVLSPYTPESFVVWKIGKAVKGLRTLATRVRRLDGEYLYYFANSALEGVLDAVEFRKKRVVTEAMRASGRELAKRFGYGR